MKITTDELELLVESALAFDRTNGKLISETETEERYEFDGCIGTYCFDNGCVVSYERKPINE